MTPRPPPIPSSTDFSADAQSSGPAAERLATQEVAAERRATQEAGRYARQVLYEHVGAEGQRRLAAARVVLVGCGALGTVLAETLVRAGVGSLRICDRDFIELNNLQRQVLFDEDDIAAGLPKAEAAARKLRRINSTVTIEAEIVDVNPGNAASLADRADLILDGTDNFETRFLINDLAVQTRRPWVYGAVVGATGLCMAVLPGDTPCLRCVFESAPPLELTPTCDTAGVLGPAVSLVAGFQALEAMKILMGRTADVIRRLISIDAWSGRVTLLNVAAAEADCPCCRGRKFDYLEGGRTGAATSLCGRNAVQIVPPRPAPNEAAPDSTTPVNFAAVADKLRPVASGEVRVNPYMLTAQVGDLTLTLFPDGRAIIKGTSSIDAAKSAYAKYLGC